MFYQEVVTLHGQVLVVVHPLRLVLADCDNGFDRLSHRLADPAAFQVGGGRCSWRVGSDLAIDHVAHASVPAAVAELKL
jgi:hypothetical protein